MNRDWHEKRIRELFHELRHEDERKAPSFNSVLKPVALPGGVRRGPGLMRLAAIGALPVLAVVVAVLLLATHSTGPVPPGDFAILQDLLDSHPPEPSRPLIPDGSPTIQPNFATRPRGRRLASQTRASSILISQWQSPTDSLLNMPGSDLLKRLPRVPDSSPGITKAPIENHN